MDRYGKNYNGVLCLAEKNVAPEEKASIMGSLNRFVIPPVFLFVGKVVDACAPDRFLLFMVNLLDHRVPDAMISLTIKAVDRLVPDRLLSLLIRLADKYVPDSLANSRKVCAILAAVGKYIPDSIIPVDSLERWENLKTKFHVPRLISNKR